jgi:hypothetical protein
MSANENDDWGQLRKDMDVSLDPFESRLDKLSVKSKNAPIGVRMNSWQLLQLGSVMQSESNIQNVLDLDSFFPCTKSDVLAWWRILGIYGIDPQSTSLVLHAFLVCLILFSIHVCISENNNENTSWRSINSSNVSNTIMMISPLNQKFLMWLYPST